ncbi:MAG TPA: copper-binding protein [Thermoanaerobaculia bacterium]|nr:copper-binding protein [Thermoanaerobaculia bacterium]
MRVSVLLLILGVVMGCAGEGSDSGRTYTTRGQVIQLPDPANPGTGLTLNHEAVDQFVDRQGETVGMDPMSMPFPVSKDVSLDGIQVGDVVEFDLHVDWSKEPAAEISRIRELPAGTKLDFRAAKPQKESK